MKRRILDKDKSMVEGIRIHQWALEGAEEFPYIHSIVLYIYVSYNLLKTFCLLSKGEIFLYTFSISRYSTKINWRD